MNKSQKKLSLGRETLRRLSDAGLKLAAGGIFKITDGCPKASDVCPSGPLYHTCGPCPTNTCKSECNICDTGGCPIV